MRAVFIFALRGDPADPLGLQHTWSIERDEPGGITVVRVQRLAAEAQRDDERIPGVRRRHRGGPVPAVRLQRLDVGLGVPRVDTDERDEVPEADPRSRWRSSSGRRAA
jgi:hypothetical protein